MDGCYYITTSNCRTVCKRWGIRDPPRSLVIKGKQKENRFYRKTYLPYFQTTTFVLITLLFWMVLSVWNFLFYYFFEGCDFTEK
jgi:hypothetical protein